jgi:hypothetical protein
MATQKWQSDFEAEIKDLTNRELYDDYIAMLTGNYFDQDDNTSPDDVDWMVEAVEEELDYRLRDWFDEGTDPEDDLDEDGEFREPDPWDPDNRYL